MSSVNKSVAEEGEIVELTPKEFLPIIIGHIEAGEPVGVEGPPGAAKSAIIALGAKFAKKPMFVHNCELSDVTDYKGLPFRDVENNNQVVWLKDKAWMMDYPSVLFFDELPRGKTDVQGAIAPVFWENRIDDLILPAGTCAIWAGNRTSDRAGANRVPSIIYNRCFMYAVKYDSESQIEHMLTLDDIDTLTMRYLRMKGDTAFQFDPAKKINSTPRAWTTVAQKLFAHPNAPFAVIAGKIGKGYASELMAFRDLAPSLPSPEEVLLTPDKARVPDNTSAQFLITDMLADQASVNTMDALITYVKRLPPEMQGKFVKDSMNRCPEVASTKAFVAWAVKFGEVLR